MGDGPQPETAPLLDYDAELGRGLAPERLAAARAQVRVTTVALARGRWDPGPLADRCPHGLLVLDGLLSRDTSLGRTVSMQLLGRGDLIRPGDPPEEGLLAVAVAWQVWEPATVALLDDRFLAAARRWPELVAALFGRLAAQAERQATQRAVCQLPRVEDRIHALLWFLAERWGRVTPGGVVVPLRLTHAALGRHVGARRPTVSLAVKTLAAAGAVQRRADGAWLLRTPFAAPDGDVASGVARPARREAGARRDLRLVADLAQPRDRPPQQP